MIRYRFIFYSISGTMFILSILAFIFWGLKPSIDFAGGSLLEGVYSKSRPPIEVLKDKLKDSGLKNFSIQPVAERGLILRFQAISEEEHQILLNSLNFEKDKGNNFLQKRFDSIGPIIGRELQRKAWTALGLVILMIILFIAIAFRKVSRPVSSWKYGLSAILALIHDVTLPVGVFCVLGHFKNVEVGVLFVTALLTILGFSVHDTIVVFDRVRENLKKGIGSSFEETVDLSLKQVSGRSIKTSCAIILVLFSLLLFGGETTRYFSLTLILGITFGTYSSLFLASPLLVTWYNLQRKAKNRG